MHGNLQVRRPVSSIGQLADRDRIVLGIAVKVAEAGLLSMHGFFVATTSPHSFMHGDHQVKRSMLTVTQERKV